MDESPTFFSGLLSFFRNEMNDDVGKYIIAGLFIIIVLSILLTKLF